MNSSAPFRGGDHRTLEVERVEIAKLRRRPAGRTQWRLLARGRVPGSPEFRRLPSALRIRMPGELRHWFQQPRSKEAQAHWLAGTEWEAGSREGIREIGCLSERRIEPGAPRDIRERWDDSDLR